MGKREQPRKIMEFSKLILLFETLLVGYVFWRVLGFVETAIALSTPAHCPT